MSENPSHDWISAYADGELSPSEKARVEEELRHSAEATRELAEIRMLSGLLAEPVSVEVPPDFSARVMRQAEQESLIGKAPEPVAGAPRRSRRFARFVAAGTSVAGLALALLLLSTGSHPNQRADNSTRIAAPMMSAHTNDASGNRSLDESVTDSRQLAAARFHESMDREVNSDELQMADLQLGLTPILISPIDLKATAEIGDVIQALSLNADQVAVVELTVVDRQQGIDSLQFILSGLSIREDSSVTRSNGRTRDAGLYAVFVEADSARMESALAKLKADMDFATIEVSTTVPASDLEPYFASYGYSGVEFSGRTMLRREGRDGPQKLGEKAETLNPQRSEPLIAERSAPQAESVTPPQPADVSPAEPSATPLPGQRPEQPLARNRQMIVNLPEKETFEFFELSKSRDGARRRAASASGGMGGVGGMGGMGGGGFDGAAGSGRDRSSHPASSLQSGKRGKLDSVKDAAPELESLLPVQVLFVLRADVAELPLTAPKPPAR
jgi:anti-sigma factor RsiW